MKHESGYVTDPARYAEWIKENAARARRVEVFAGDHNAEALELAAINAQLLQPVWCRCKPDSMPDNMAYFRNPSGSHGWMCVKCRGILQTG